MAEFYDSEPLDDGQIGGGRVWGGYDGDSLIIVYGPSAFGGMQMPNGQTELRLSRAAVDRFLAGVPSEAPAPAGIGSSPAGASAPAGGPSPDEVNRMLDSIPPASTSQPQTWGPGVSYGGIIPSEPGGALEAQRERERGENA